MVGDLTKDVSGRTLDRGVVGELLAEGNLDPKQLRNELWRRDVSFVKSYDRTLTVLFLPLAALWLVPAISQRTNCPVLRYAAQLRSVRFPPAVFCVAAGLFGLASALEVWLNLARYRMGGCHDIHETVALIRDGPYGLVRHPGYLTELVYFGVLPVVVSRWVPYTVLAALATCVADLTVAWMIRVEDAFNVKKWGQEYQEYMREVPALNFVRGFIRMRKRRRQEAE